MKLLLLVGLTVGLSACAGRPKPLDPTRPYTVTEVQVTAESIDDDGFADRLRQRLEATAGRATSEIGQVSVLHVVVLDYGKETGLINFFDNTLRAASLTLVLVDADTGAVMRSGALRSSARGQGEIAETALIGRLAEDVRLMLGLSGYAQHPVSGAKRAVVHPLGRPENLTDLELLSADPLLNGTVTPTTPDLELDAAPTLDISRPLLSTEPDEDGSGVVQTDVSASPGATSSDSAEHPLPPATPDAATEPSPGEPCVITLDNDCSEGE